MLASSTGHSENRTAAAPGERGKTVPFRASIAPLLHFEDLRANRSGRGEVPLLHQICSMGQWIWLAYRAWHNLHAIAFEDTERHICYKELLKLSREGW